MTDFLTSEKLAGLIQAAYIIAGVLFIFALAGLSKHETAKRGNQFGMAGMGLALSATLVLAARNTEILESQRPLAVTLGLTVVAMAIGGVIGAWRARTVEMTGMPELVAMLHSFVGVAAVLVGYNSFLEPGAENEGALAAIHSAEVFLGVFIGAVTFTGSIVAFMKLSERMKSAPLVLPQRHKLNALILLVSGVLLVLFMGNHDDSAIIPLGIMTALALFLGFHLVAAIGGGDMPVVVSMLNSYSGWAAAAGRPLRSNQVTSTAMSAAMSALDMVDRIRDSDCTQHCPCLVLAFLTFEFRNRVRDDAGTRLYVGATIPDECRANCDGGVHIAGEIEVADASSVEPTPNRFQRFDDLHRAGLRCTGQGAGGERCSEQVVGGVAVAQHRLLRSCERRTPGAGPIASTAAHVARLRGSDRQSR